MFFRIYFSRKKFDECVENAVQERIRRKHSTIKNYSAVLENLRKAREHLLLIDTWDTNKKLFIDVLLVQIQHFLESPADEKQEELWDIKFIKDGETIEVVDTYASAEACRMELAYYRSKPGIGVRYFMEKSNG